MGYSHAFKHEFMTAGKAAPSTGKVTTNFNTEDGITGCYGITKPADAATGYAPGCIFKHVDGTTGTTVYVNEGTKASADFNAVVTNENFATIVTPATLVSEIDSTETSGTAAAAGPSPLIWDGSLWAAVDLDPSKGYKYFNDYLGTVDITTTDGYTLTQTTTGGITGSVTEDGGALFLDSAGNGTADDGIEAQLTNCLFKPVAGRTIRFEARVKMNDTSANISQFAIGLAGIDTSLIDAGVVDDTVDKAMFFRHAATTGDRLSVIAAKTTAEDIDVDKVTTVDATYIKLGFVIDGVTDIKWYADGVLVHTSAELANIPNAVMCLSYVSKTEGASKDSELTVDWVRILSEGARTA